MVIKLINFLLKQKLFVNLLVILILMGGYFALTNINREAIPEVNFDMMTIMTIYPGGSPDELEQLISIPIEKKLREVDGLDKVRAYNIENVSVVAVFIDDEAADKKAVVQSVKDAVEKVEGLPDKAERPVVEEIKLDKSPVINIAIYGKKPGVPYRIIREEAKNIEDFLYSIDGVAAIEDFGYRDREFHIEVNPSSLKKYRIGMNTVINTLKNRNLDLPGGALRIGDKEFVLRTKGQYKNIKEIKNTVVMSNDIGFVTRIKDVAAVSDTFKEATVYERFNGRKSIIFTIWKKRSADEIELVNRLRHALGNYKLLDSKNVTTQLYNDYSKYTKNRINSVITNAITGFALLALILMLLLGLRMSAIVTASIPVAFMVAFIGMKFSNITLNVISMFGMIMVLGMIVDFGIVVSENSYRYMESGLNRVNAIKKGVGEVVWPVTITLLCICAAFAPLLFLSGIMGKFMRALPIVLIICLAASWYCAMFILPTHLSIFAKPSLNTKGNPKNTDKKNRLGLFVRMQQIYRGFLSKVLKHRYITLAALIILLVASMALTGIIGFVFMPGGGAEQLQIKTRFPQGTNLQANLREIRKIEKIILKIPEDEFSEMHARIGLEASFGLDPKPGEGTHKSTIEVYLTPEKNRTRDAGLILDQIREDIITAQKREQISKKMQFEFEIQERKPPVGKPVNVEIRGKDFAVLKKISQEYIDYLKTVDGVIDISMDLEEGKQEYRYIINEVMASRTKVSVVDVAMALNASFEGALATNLKIGEEDIDIRVRFPEDARRRVQSLEEVMIANSSGGLIPLNLVTKVKKQPGYSQINRLNYKRIAQVQAQVDTSRATSMKVNRMLAGKFKDVEKRYPGYSISYGGEEEFSKKSMGELGILFPIALFVIFILLAVFFKSLILPVVVMSAIPFSLVGVIFALWIHGEPLSFMSMLGLFSLAGVIVSNTLVLVQFINNKRDEGLSLKDALLEGGVIRLRPVILTTGTTVLALFPTIYGLGGKDYFVAPLALAFGYGLIFATFITLALIPCFYHIAEDIKGGVAKILSLMGIKIRSTLYITDTEEYSEKADNQYIEKKIEKLSKKNMKKK